MNIGRNQRFVKFSAVGRLQWQLRQLYTPSSAQTRPIGFDGSRKIGSRPPVKSSSTSKHLFKAHFQIISKVKRYL